MPPIKKTAILYPAILISILGALILSIILTFVIQECYKEKVYTYDQLKDGLDSALHYKTKSHRIVAENIYEYKIAKELHNVDDTFVTIFLMNRNTDLQTLRVSTLTDVCLHKLVTSTPKDFPRLLYYVPIFNHELYAQCMVNYDHRSKKFNNFDKSTPTRSIIINNILQINNHTTSGVLQDVVNRILYQLNDAEDDEFLYTILNGGYSAFAN